VTVIGGSTTIENSDYRARIRHQLRGVLVFVAFADVLVLAAAVLIAWALRLTLDVWGGGIDPAQSLSSTAGPWIVFVWLLVLAAQGAYSVRFFGDGPEEFKLVFLGSVLSFGFFGTACYLLQQDLSRGFLLLAFFLGAPMLLVERYAARQVLHGLRRDGHLRHRVVAVGGPSAVTELVGAHLRLVADAGPRARVRLGHPQGLR